MPARTGPSPLIGRNVAVSDEELAKLLEAARFAFRMELDWWADKNKPVVLLDYNTNPDPYNPKSPLSHASLIKAYIEGNYPE